MDDRTLDHFKELFIAMKKKQLQGIYNLDKEDWGDHDQTLRMKLEQKRSHYLKKINNALKRIEQGTFGLCTECDGVIEAERIFMKPTTERCQLCVDNDVLTDREVSTRVGNVLEKIVPFPATLSEGAKILPFRPREETTL